MRAKNQRTHEREERWLPRYTTVELFGLRGVSYRIGLYGFSQNPTACGDCWSSETTTFKAELGLKAVTIPVPTSCREISLRRNIEHRGEPAKWHESPDRRFGSS
jgi:hypothetical protein